MSPTQIDLPVSVVSQVKPGDGIFSSLNVGRIEVSKHDVRGDVEVFVLRNEHTYSRSLNLLLLRQVPQN